MCVLDFIAGMNEKEQPYQDSRPSKILFCFLPVKIHTEL